MSATSPTRREILTTAAAAGATSLLPGTLAAAGDGGTIPFIATGLIRGRP